MPGGKWTENRCFDGETRQWEGRSLRKASFRTGVKDKKVPGGQQGQQRRRQEGDGMCRALSEAGRVGQAVSAPAPTARTSSVQFSPQGDQVAGSPCSVSLGLGGTAVGKFGVVLRSPSDDQVWQKERSCWWPRGFWLGKLACTSRFRDRPGVGSIVGIVTEVPGNSASSSPS